MLALTQYYKAKFIVIKEVTNISTKGYSKLTTFYSHIYQSHKILKQVHKTHSSSAYKFRENGKEKELKFRQSNDPDLFSSALPPPQQRKTLQNKFSSPKSLPPAFVQEDPFVSLSRKKNPSRRQPHQNQHTASSRSSLTRSIPHYRTKPPETKCLSPLPPPHARLASLKIPKPIANNPRQYPSS